MPKSEVLSYSCSKFSATTIIKLVVSKPKCDVVLRELVMFMMWFMKEYNSFDDIQFFSFHTFSSICRDIFIVTLNKIHRYTWNFMRHKMIYFLSHKFTSKNLCFSPFYEHFRQLREKYAFKLLIK